MTLDVEQMPKRIWAKITDTDDGGQYGDWWDWVALGAISYVRADLFDAQAAEIAALKERLAKADKVIAALGACVAEGDE